MTKTKSDNKLNVQLIFAANQDKTDLDRSHYPISRPLAVKVYESDEVSDILFIGLLILKIKLVINEK